MLNSKIITVSIRRPYDEVYAYLCQPQNLAKWAANPGSELEPLGGFDWLVDLPRGRMVIRLSPPNTFGVLDYQTFPRGMPGGPVTPVRAYPNDCGTEVAVVWFQRPGIADAQFASDTEWVAVDLQRLKALLESIPA